MENYSLNRLVIKLSDDISEIEMPGFDECNDESWNGDAELEVNFIDCDAILKCDISKLWYEGEISQRKVIVKEAALIFDGELIPFKLDDISKIEEELNFG